MAFFEATVVTSVLFVVLVLTSLAYNPRLWIRDFPEEIQAEMDPLSAGEQVARIFLAILLLAVVVGIPVLSVLSVKATQGSVTLVEAFLHIWLIFMAVNLIDLTVIDWMIGVWWQPEFLSTPELDSARQYNTYRFHFIEHRKGTIVLTALALGLGALVSVRGVSSASLNIRNAAFAPYLLHAPRKIFNIRQLSWELGTHESTIDVLLNR